MRNLKLNQLPLKHQIMNSQHIGVKKTAIPPNLRAIWTMMMVCLKSVYVKNTLNIYKNIYNIKSRTRKFCNTNVYPTNYNEKFAVSRYFAAAQTLYTKHTANTKHIPTRTNKLIYTG